MKRINEGFLFSSKPVLGNNTEALQITQKTVTMTVFCNIHTWSHWSESNRRPPVVFKGGISARLQKPHELIIYLDFLYLFSGFIHRLVVYDNLIYKLI